LFSVSGTLVGCSQSWLPLFLDWTLFRPSLSVPWPTTWGWSPREGRSSCLLGFPGGSSSA
jgi:hypothetical protein